MEKAEEQPFFQLFVLLLVSCCFGVSIGIDNITISQPLIDSQTIVSPNQTFKLCFFSPANTTNRYVGIMYNDVPVQTVIWVANRNKPLNDSAGTFTISEDGNLVVLNGQKEILWSSNVSDSVRNSTAQLSETGNLVLTENYSGRIIWESFQIPVDSFLRSMRISTTEKLTSWSSPSDPSTGNFSVGLETTQITQVFVWDKSKPRWRSGPWEGTAFSGVPEMNSFYLNGFSLINSGTDSPYITYTYANDGTLIYLQLTSDGYFQQKNWQEGQKDWNISWSTIQNQCGEYGKCGPFGSCNLQNSPICTCLKGFQPRDDAQWNRGNWTGGCIRRTSLQCERKNSTGQEGQPDGYLRLTSVKVPDFAEWKDATDYECGSYCSKNCSCIAYAFRTGIGCMHWSDPLIDIQQFSSGGADLYMRLANSELDNKKNKTAIIASIAVVGFFSVAVTAYIFWKWLAKRRGKNKDDEFSLIEAANVHKKESKNTSSLKDVAFEELPLYSYETLAYATDHFHSRNKLGKGGFGQVYMGNLADSQEIAVKRLSKSSGQGIEEFMNEVVLISKLQHRNLVRLLGCCVEREEKMLIYEYMPNGSLDTYLFDSAKQVLLNWRRRALIVEGIGRGLLYLHRDSRLKIIHRDLKASNILLDENLNPKISDFGLARIFGGNQDEAGTRRVVGTYGYMSPEYAMEGIFSEKSDVYSFGVLLLEIVSGRRNTSFSYDENELSLVRYAWRLWNEGEAVKVIDPSIFYPNIEMEILRYVHVGLLCVQEFAKDRPNVSAILSMLNSEISELPCPKLPAFTGRVVSSGNESSQQTAHSINSMSLTIVEAR